MRVVEAKAKEYGASSVTETISAPAKLSAEIASLDRIGLQALQSKWHKLFRSTAPDHLPRYLLVRIIAYRLQVKAFGDLDRDSIQYLEKVIKTRADRPGSKNRKTRKQPPPIPPVPAKRSLKPGTILVREYAGKLHRVMVRHTSFSWEDCDYQSLSEVAFAITGTNWNGPRFFGLRGKALSQPDTGGPNP